MFLKTYFGQECISILLKTMYQHQGKLLGYGMKIWPLADELVKRDKLFKWLPENNHYK